MKSDTANMHQGCGLKVTQQTQIILMPLYDIPLFFQELSQNIFFNPKCKNIQSSLAFYTFDAKPDVDRIVSHRPLVKSE